MASFDTVQKEDIRNYLGAPRINEGEYLYELQRIDRAIDFSDYTSEFITYVGSVITKLKSVDTLLEGLLADSMATKTKYVELDYVQQRNLCYQQGDNYLCELASLLNVPILFNKYPTHNGSYTSY